MTDKIIFCATCGSRFTWLKISEYFNPFNGQPGASYRLECPKNVNQSGHRSSGITYFLNTRVSELPMNEMGDPYDQPKEPTIDDDNTTKLAKAIPCMCDHEEHEPYKCSYRYDTGRCDCGGWKENIAAASKAANALGWKPDPTSEAYYRGEGPRPT